MKETFIMKAMTTKNHPEIHLVTTDYYEKNIDATRIVFVISTVEATNNLEIELRKYDEFINGIISKYFHKVHTPIDNPCLLT